MITAKQRVPALRGGQSDDLAANGVGCDRISLWRTLDGTESTFESLGIWGMSVNQAAPDKGGWNVNFGFLDRSVPNTNPYSNVWIRADGPAAFNGWPTSPRIEALRAAWLDVGNIDEQRRICVELQMQLWQDVPYIPMGEYWPRPKFSESRAVFGGERDFAPTPAHFAEVPRTADSLQPTRYLLDPRLKLSRLHARPSQR